MPNCINFDIKQTPISLKIKEVQKAGGDIKVMVYMRVAEGYIEHSIDGETWTKLIAVEELEGAPGTPGTPGNDGITPNIGTNGNWYLGNEDTGKPSRGEKGEDATVTLKTWTIKDLEKAT